MLDEKKVPHVYRVIPGGAHDFKVWKSDLYTFAQLIFREPGQEDDRHRRRRHRTRRMTSRSRPSPRPVEDFKPASSNQPGKQYPQVNSEGRARFRIVAPQGPERAGARVGRGHVDEGRGRRLGRHHAPLDEGFHYYRINIDGAEVPDPSSKFFYGASRWGSAIEIPAKDAGLLRPQERAARPAAREPVLLQEHQHHPPLLRLHAARLRQGHRASAIRCCISSTAAARTKPAGAARAART